MLSIQNWEQGKISLPTTHIQHCTKIPRHRTKTKQESRGRKGRTTIEKIIQLST